MREPNYFACFTPALLTSRGSLAAPRLQHSVSKIIQSLFFSGYVMCPPAAVVIYLPRSNHLFYFPQRPFPCRRSFPLDTLFCESFTFSERACFHSEPGFEYCWFVCEFISFLTQVKLRTFLSLLNFRRYSYFRFLVVRCPRLIFFFSFRSR